MKKYYVANTDKTKFAYITTVPQWCVHGGETKFVYDCPKPHIFSLQRAKRVMSYITKNNLTEYQLFEIDI